MSDQFYSYLSSKLFEYFEKNPLVKGDKFYIQFDEDSQIIYFYNNIGEYGKINSLYDDFTYQHEKGDEFKTFSIRCGEIKLVIVQSTTINEDYLVTLRNQVSAQNGIWDGTALLIIYNNAKDSIFNGMGNLASEGMPFNIKYISENLEDEIGSCKNLDKSSREIIKFSINNLKEDIFQTTIWDYKTILAIIKREKIIPVDLYDLKLFPDKNLKGRTAPNMQKRLKKNHNLFDKVESCRRYSDMKECLKKNSFSDWGANRLSEDKWFEMDYTDVKNLIIRPGKKFIYIENSKKETDEGLKYWVKPLSSSSAGKRKIQIIIFNDKSKDKVSFRLSFNQKTKNKYLKNLSKNFVSSSGYGLKVEFKVSPNEPTFKQISYKHNEKNNSHYIFNLLVLNASSDIFDSIKSRYSIDYKKKRLTITNEDDDGDEIIFGIGDTVIEKEIEDSNEKVYLYDEESVLISDESPALEEDTFQFDLVYNENSIPISIVENSKKPYPVSSNVIWNLKRQNKENFILNGNKATQGVFDVYLEEKFKEFLDLERQIIDKNIFYGIKGIDGNIKKQEVHYSDDLSNAYLAILNYFKEFDDTIYDNLPSLFYLNDDLKELYENFLEIYNHEISEIENNEILANNPYKKDLIKIGRIDDDRRIMYSSLSPINIAYQLEIANQCDGDFLPNYLAERLVPNNLIPYLYSDSDELYRPIYQEHAHEWLIYEKSQDVSIGTTNAFISNVVSDKLNQFVEHFNYLFEINNKSPIKINLININDDIEVVKGVFKFIRDRIPDKPKNKNKKIIPVEINIYNDSSRSSFETLFKCTSKEDIKDIFGINISSNLLDETDILHLIQNNIKYYHKSIKDDFEYAHCSFYKITSDNDDVFDNIDKMETGLSLNGLISSVSSTTNFSDYRTGFGIKNVLNKENILVKSAININELVLNSKNHGKNSYSKNRAVFTSITLDDDNISKLYQKSHWVTFIEPTFGIEYFDNSNDVVIIHYSDQYSSSNKYDTITVTYDPTQYKHAINKFLKEKDDDGDGIELNDKDLNGVIKMFNSINGEWLLNIVSSPGQFGREKLSMISAAKYGLALLEHKDILWIPISLEEILRISRGLKLDRSQGPISAFIDGSSRTDDLLFMGLIITDENNLKVVFHPVEVKIGQNNSGVISKGINQLKRTYKLFHDLLDGDESEFLNKFFRNFFMQLFLSNQQKLIVNEVWDEKDLGRINKFKSKLLNDDYEITYGLEEFLGRGTLFSFKTDCHDASIETKENRQVIQIPEEFVYDSLSKSVQRLCSDIQSGETDFIADKLFFNAVLNNITDGHYEPDTNLDDDYNLDDDETIVSDSVDENLDDESSVKEDETDFPEVVDDSSNESDSDEATVTENNNDSSEFKLDNVRGLIGTVEGSNHEIYWEFGSSEVNNRHLLIQGASGYGKSYFIQKMLKELSNQGIPSIIIDYTEGFKKSKLEPEFKESMGDKIEYHSVYANKFPLNPFKRHLVEVDDEYVPGDNVSIASRFKDVIDSVYNFGGQQEIAIYNAVLSGLDKYDEKMDLIKFKEELIKQDSPYATSALNKITQFLDVNPFKTDDFDWSCIDEMDGKIRIIQLTGYSKDIQLVITEFILLDLWNYKSIGDEDRPFIVVLDEAQNLEFGNKDAPGYKILKEGRKFGWSGWFATQFLKGAMKSDEINTLENASEKIYFHPTDNSISDIAGNLSKDGDKKYWEQKLSKLNKGQCIVHGHLRNSSGEIYPAKPVCVDISPIGVDSPDNLDDESNDEDDKAGTKFIIKRGSKFYIYKTINGDKKHFGTFDSLDDAIKRRDELTAQNWGYSVDDLPTPGKKAKYGKYIMFHNGYFKVSKLLNGHQHFFGAFKNVEDAVLLRDKLIENNWDFSKIPDDILKLSNDFKNKYIYKFRDDYVIMKTVDGEKQVFGRFDNLNEALKYRNWLITNNWPMIEDEVIDEEKIDEFVYLINDEYIVRNEIDGELKIFGRFSDMGEAIRFRNKCVRLNWKLD